MSSVDSNLTVAGAASQKFSQAASALNSASVPAASSGQTNKAMHKVRYNE